MSDERPAVDADEARSRRRVRVATVTVTLVLVVAEVAADIVSNLFAIGSFHANEAVIGTLLGCVALLSGVEVPRILKK